MAHRPPQEGGEPGDFIATGRGRADRGQDLRGKRSRYALIGIDRPRPIAARLRQREILLGAKARPRAGYDGRARRDADLDGIVVAAAIAADALLAQGPAL